MVQFELTLSLFTLVCLVGQTFAYLTSATRAQGLFTRQLQAEVELHWCAQLEANKANLKQAYTWAQKTLPHLRSEVEKNFQDEMEAQALPERFKVTSDSSGSCRHTDLPSLQTFLYRQLNPSIPPQWPNWHYGFTARHGDET